MSNDAPQTDREPVPQCPTPGPRTRAVRRRVFLFWAAVLTALWVFANWPQAAGGLKSWLIWAGLPWPFAHWEDNRLVRFRPLALAADVAVWVGLMVVAWLCAWSRVRQSHQDVRRAG